MKPKKPRGAKKVNKAIGYIRVSTQQQAEEGVSLEAQRAKIEAWCLVNNYELTNVLSDEGISGSKSNREGLLKALGELEKGNALVVYSLSRLTRSTKDMLQISDQLESKGSDIVSLTEKIDTTTAAGKMVFRMLAVLNEFERDQISERTKLAMGHKKEQRECYSPTPYGFKTVDGYNIPGTKLQEDKKEQAVISNILKLRKSGKSLRLIAEDLNKRKIKPKRGSQWYASSVSYLINRVA